MATSDKKIRANRENGQKTPGPIDTSKSRFSARKHGLASKGLTALDDAAAYRTIVCGLKREKNPIGILETELVEAAAFDMVGWRRARLLEGQQITSLLHPPQHEKNLLKELDFNLQGALLDPGIPAEIFPGNVEQLLNVFQRYQSCFANRLFRTLHELERLQRMRQGERVPAPAAVDLGVHADAGTLDSTSAAVELSKAQTGGVERLPAPAVIDVTVDADAGRLATPAAQEPPKAPSSDVVRLPNGHAESGLVESGPAEPEQGAALAVPEVTDRKVPVPDPAPAWKPRAPAGPIWKR